MCDPHTGTTGHMGYHGCERCTSVGTVQGNIPTRGQKRIRGSDDDNHSIGPSGTVLKTGGNERKGLRVVHPLLPKVTYSNRERAKKQANPASKNLRFSDRPLEQRVHPPRRDELWETYRKNELDPKNERKHAKNYSYIWENRKFNRMVSGFVLDPMDLVDRGVCVDAIRFTFRLVPGFSPPKDAHFMKVSVTMRLCGGLVFFFFFFFSETVKMFVFNFLFRFLFA